jgi:SulP family sulfate permease
MLAPHFTARALQGLADLLDVWDIGAGEALFRRGDAGDALYIVEEGRVTVSLPLADGRSVRLRSFGPGTIIGEMAVYTNAPRSADVFADEPARLRRLTLAALRKLELDDPLTAQEWHRFVVKMMASRLAVADEALRAAS